MPTSQIPGDQPPAEPGAAAAKLALRDQLLTARRRRPLTEVGAAARAIAAHLLAAEEVRRSATVAAYVSLGTEPGTSQLLDDLLASGRRVVVPLLRPDNDLDWAVYRGSSSLAPARRGLLEPASPALGPEAVTTADAVLVPGLAVSPDGMRLGRGGGSYDRALARVPVGTFTCALLYDDEVGLDVPSEAHDRPVTAAVSPRGVVRFA